MDEPRQILLIVDDNPENITILGELLRSEYDIRVATNGEKALGIVLSDDPPDIILLDVMMPGMDGYEVCRRIKVDRGARDIPVIFITAKNLETDEVRGFECGAVDYITKPFSPIVVRARVRTHAELKKFRDALKNASLTDSLTGLPNRRRFEDYLTIALNIATRVSRPLAVLMIDIDHFKLFNDTNGHQEGDTCLAKVAAALAAGVHRKTDLVARYGGEEFICIMQDTGFEKALSIAEELRKSVLALEIPHPNSTTGAFVSISLGVAVADPGFGSPPAELVHLADEALYEAKNHGRNQVRGKGMANPVT